METFILLYFIFLMSRVNLELALVLVFRACGKCIQPISKNSSDINRKMLEVYYLRFSERLSHGNRLLI